jgi:hypothetical protein
MAPCVGFHFDFGSPNAYLAHLVIPAIEQRSGARFVYVPVLLGGVFKATDNVAPAVALRGIKNKGESCGARDAPLRRESTAPRASRRIRSSRSHAPDHARRRGCARPRLLRALRRRGLSAHVGGSA